MFKRKNRIPREKLEEIIKQSKALGGDFFNVKISENEASLPRFAVVVSKKVAKSSVGRHLLKRRLFSCIRNNYSTFGNRDYVFFLKKESANLDFRTLLAYFTRFITENSL